MTYGLAKSAEYNSASFQPSVSSCSPPQELSSYTSHHTPLIHQLWFQQLKLQATPAPGADFVARAALCEPPCADFVAGAALCEPPCADVVVGAALCEPPCADFVAGTALCAPPCANALCS